MYDFETAYTDIDEYVSLRQVDGKIIVEVTAAGFRQPPGVIAGLVTELASRLPRPGTEADKAVAAGIDAIGKLHEAVASGGYEAFAATARSTLGIDGPANTLSRDPEFDRAMAARLDGVLKTMRQAQTARAEPPVEVLTAEARTDEDDISVTSSTELAVAAVRIGPDARYRGVDGLGQAITDLIERARATVRELAAAQTRDRLPEGVAEATDAAPAAGEQAARDASAVIDLATQFGEDVKRKAGR